MSRRRFVQSGALLTTAVGAGVVPGRAAAAGPAGSGTSGPLQVVPAFPGAEGSGKYVSGGRGGDVYVVTNLDDGGPGSLRDAVSQSNRTVVFAVSGNIDITAGGRLEVLGDNITIAGQTAPGDGICVVGHEFAIRGSNIIVRYLRVRAGDGAGSSIDAFKSEGTSNVIIDHCSVSWGVDECFSLHGSTNLTVQWCIIAEGLTMSEHEKGRHGYGGLWGGDNVTYHHNLLVHQGGRNPRFSFIETMPMLVDHQNNVIYDYGYTSMYGGEWCEGINVVDNYYKPGPATLDSIASTITAPGRFGQWHLDGNVIEGHPDVTADNGLGIDYAVGGINRLPEPAMLDIPVERQPAEEAYQAVLEGVGAILPRRDSVDARLIQDVIDGTGRLINSQREVGGPPPLHAVDPPRDSDGDGIPDEWEKANGLDPRDPEDGKEIGEDGYSNLERYLNSIERVGAPNPTVHLTSPTLDRTYSGTGETQTVEIEATAEAADGAQVAVVEFFADDRSLGVSQTAPYRLEWDAPDGTHYLRAVATDDTGTSSSSSAVGIHVGRTSALGAWTSGSVGNPSIPGSAFLANEEFTIRGSGKIRGRDGSCHFVYREVEVGPDDILELTARVVHLSRPYQGVTAGLMIRESLEPDAQYFMGGMTWHDDGAVVRVTRMATDGTEPSVGDFPWDGVYDEVRHYLRLRKRGRELSLHVSTNALNWERAGYERMDLDSNLLIGMAVDGNKEANAIANYTVARFTQVGIAW